MHPPHLDGYPRSERGEFRLIELPGGRTRFEGRTWYRLDLAPRSYWSPRSDALIRRIHRRVLSHVKALSEGVAATCAITAEHVGDRACLEVGDGVQARLLVFDLAYGAWFVSRLEDSSKPTIVRVRRGAGNCT